MSKKNPLPTPPSAGYFLMNDKTLYGPYNRREIDFLRQRGHFKKFAWLWDENEKEWKQTADSAQPTAPLKSRPKKSNKIRALVFDKKMAVSGWISQLNLDGAIFVTPDPRSMPPFGKKQKVQVNLILEGSSQSIIVDGQLDEAKMVDKKWQYKLSWKSIPTELSQLIEVVIP